MTYDHLKRHRVAAFVTVFLLSTGLTLLIFFRPGEMLAQRWQNQLSRVENDQVLTQMRRIAQLNDAGTRVLVESLASHRLSVVKAAKTVIAEQVERWRLLPAKQSTPRVAVLANHLSTWVRQFGPDERRAAGDLATQILLWPLDAKSVDRSELIARCETVLRATRNYRGGPNSHTVMMESEKPFAQGQADLAIVGSSPSSTRIGDDETPLTNLPGGGVPIDIVSVPQLPPQRSSPEPDEPDIETPNLFQPSPNTKGISLHEEPEQLTTPFAGKIRRSVEPVRVQRAERPQIKSLTMIDDHRQEPTSMDRTDQMDDEQLIKLLRANDRFRVAAAEMELQQRGYSDTELTLGRRLNDPDPAIRLTLAEVLPRLKVDARRWLWWLSRDEDPQVRATAATILATTRDPLVIQRLRRMELEEADDSVRRQLREILKRY